MALHDPCFLQHVHILQKLQCDIFFKYVIQIKLDNFHLFDIALKGKKGNEIKQTGNC